MAVAPSTRLEIACESCGAKIVVEAVDRTARCAYCDSPQVVDRPATEDRPDPVFAVGFVVGKHDATARFRRWIHRKRWAPAAVRQAAAERVRGVYLPAYLYSATAHSSYTATIGEVYYQTQVRRKKVRRVRRTEYRELEGSHACYLSDVLVTASRGIPNDELERVEPFDLRGLRRYTPGLVAGWPAEEPSLSRDECLELARQEARATAGTRLRRFMPGDSHRELRNSIELRDESVDLTLVPVWVFALRYRDDRPPIRLLVNGQTGEVAGSVPISWRKISLVVATALGVLGLLAAVGAVLGWLS